MLYTIVFREKMSPERYAMVGDRDSLFAVIWALNKDSSIAEFKITVGDVILSSRDFGFGDLEKWVSKFTYSDTES